MSSLLWMVTGSPGRCRWTSHPRQGTSISPSPSPARHLAQRCSQEQPVWDGATHESEGLPLLRGRAEPALPEGEDRGGGLAQAPGNSSWGDSSLLPLPLHLPEELGEEGCQIPEDAQLWLALAVAISDWTQD